MGKLTDVLLGRSDKQRQARANAKQAWDRDRDRMRADAAELKGKVRRDDDAPKAD